MTSLSANSTISAGPIERIANVAERLICALSASHARAVAALLALGLICFLPGFLSLQPMDRDEPRFAQASKQMLETGDLVDIRFQAEARHKKPIGIYWAQAATVAAAEQLGIPEARTTIGLYRIPSLLGALAAILLSYWAALAFLDRRGALLAAGVFGVCIMLSAEARLAKTDALLAACCVAAMGGLARAYLGRARIERALAPAGRGTATLFWLAMALGILVKGPIVPLFVGLAVLILGWRERSLRWLAELRPLPGLLLTLCVVAPWFLAIAWKSGGAFFGESVGKDMMGKVGSGAEKHWGPPGAYVLAFFATFWPGAAFAALAIPFAWARRGEDAVAFLLAWIVPAWLLFELLPTKLPHYVLPLMPAVAILTVVAMRRGALDPDRRRARWIAAPVVVIPLALAIGLGAATWHFDGVLPLAGLAAMLAASAVAALAWTAFARRAVEPALALAIAASALLSPAVFGLTQPALAALKVSPRLAALRDGLPCEQPRVASLGYREPSLVFLIGTDLAMLSSGTEAVEFLKGGGCRLVFVESRFAGEFEAARGTAGVTPAEIGTVTGFNLNGGKPLALIAYASGVTPGEAGTR